MKRAEAITLLNQLSEDSVIDPTWVSIEAQGNEFKIRIREIIKNPNLESFCVKNNLRLEEQNGYWLISKP